MKTAEEKDLNYYKNNASEDYMTTPISVLRYISELESEILKLSESKQQLPVVKDWDAVEKEYKEYEKWQSFLGSSYVFDWLKQHYSPQVVKEPDGWLVHNMFNENKLILERYLTNYNINPNELKPVYYSPQVSPSDEEIIVSFQSIRFQYENNPNFTPKDVANNLRTLFSEVK